MYDLKKSREDYINYKFKNVGSVLADKAAELDILSLLDRLGFPMYDFGTYLYKNLIFEIINKIKVFDKLGDSSCLNVITQLNDRNSQFYRVFATNCDMSLDELHLRINGAVSMIDEDKMDEGLLSSLGEEYSYNLNYGELAFVLASMILGFKKEKKNNLVRIRSLVD